MRLAPKLADTITKTHFPLRLSETLQVCVSVTEIRAWKSSSFLKLDDAKTEVIIFFSAQTESRVTRSLSMAHDVRNLGIHFDAIMTMEVRVSAVCKCAIFRGGTNCPRGFLAADLTL